MKVCVAWLVVRVHAPRTFLRVVLLRLALVLEAHGALVHLISLYAVLATKALGVI